MAVITKVVLQQGIPSVSGQVPTKDLPRTPLQPLPRPEPRRPFPLPTPLTPLASARQLGQAVLNFASTAVGIAGQKFQSKRRMADAGNLANMKATYRIGANDVIGRTEERFDPDGENFEAINDTGLADLFSDIEAQFAERSPRAFAVFKNQELPRLRANARLEATARGDQKRAQYATAGANNSIAQTNTDMLKLDIEDQKASIQLDTLSVMEDLMTLGEAMQFVGPDVQAMVNKEFEEQRFRYADTFMKNNPRRFLELEKAGAFDFSIVDGLYGFDGTELKGDFTLSEDQRVKLRARAKGLLGQNNALANQTFRDLANTAAFQIRNNGSSEELLNTDAALQNAANGIAAQTGGIVSDLALKSGMALIKFSQQIFDGRTEILSSSLFPGIDAQGNRVESVGEIMAAKQAQIKTPEDQALFNEIQLDLQPLFKSMADRNWALTMEIKEGRGLSPQENIAFQRASKIPESQIQPFTFQRNNNFTDSWINGRAGDNSPIWTQRADMMSSVIANVEPNIRRNWMKQMVNQHELPPLGQFYMFILDGPADHNDKLNLLEGSQRSMDSLKADLLRISNGNQKEANDLLAAIRQSMTTLFNDEYGATLAEGANLSQFKTGLNDLLIKATISEFIKSGDATAILTGRETNEIARRVYDTLIGDDIATGYVGNGKQKLIAGPTRQFEVVTDFGLFEEVRLNIRPGIQLKLARFSPGKVNSVELAWTILNDRLPDIDIHTGTADEEFSQTIFRDLIFDGGTPDRSPNNDGWIFLDHAGLAVVLNRTDRRGRRVPLFMSDELVDNIADQFRAIDRRRKGSEQLAAVEQTERFLEAQVFKGPKGEERREERLEEQLQQRVELKFTIEQDKAQVNAVKKLVDDWVKSLSLEEFERRAFEAAGLEAEQDLR